MKIVFFVLAACAVVSAALVGCEAVPRQKAKV